MIWKLVLPVFAAICAVGIAAGFGMVGGFSNADVNEEGVQKALRFAVLQHNLGSNDMYMSEVRKVVSVQKQVVSGMNYVITVELGKTPCRKGGTEAVCVVHENLQEARPYECKFTVWSQPWTNTIKLTKHSCQPTTVV